MDKARMPYKDALKLAESFIADVGEYCERIEIAGSLRRKKETIGDLEIVAIPKIVMGLDLFGGPGEPISLLEQQLSSYRKLKNGALYKQLELASINLDLFITTPEKWGVIYTIRTGSADFSNWLVTARQKGGGLPSNMRVQDGRLWYGGAALPTPEERDFFGFICLDWIAPEKRIEGTWKR